MKMFENGTINSNGDFWAFIGLFTVIGAAILAWVWKQIFRGKK